jgi:hypothetical protein
MKDQETGEAAERILEELRKSGELDEIVQAMIEHPGANLQVIPTKEGDINVSVEWGIGRGVLAFMLHLAVSVPVGALIGTIFGWLSWLIFNFPGHPILRGCYRGMMLTVGGCLAYWITEGWWEELSLRQKTGVALLTASLLAGLAILAWLTTDFLGTVVVIGVASIFFLRQLERSS